MNIRNRIQRVRPILEDELSDETDTAIYVLSRQAGEGGDRRYEKGDYLLSDVEEESLRLLSAHYKKLVLVLNCGSVIDLSILDQVRIDAVIFYAQGGMEGGNALADILTGKVNPCGKLTDTWAYHYDDYPCADTFGYRNGDVSQEDYREDIYVGYRYFDAFSIHPRFPFGFGLSYTTFSMGRKAVLVDGSKVTVDVSVKNTGKYAGREVVQLYLQKPQMVQGVEEKSLAAFAKTGCLQPGETELVTTTFDVCDLAVYDEKKEMFVLPQGEYGVLLGTHAGAVSPVAVLTLSEDVVVEQVSAVHPFARSYERMQPGTRQACLRRKSYPLRDAGGSEETKREDTGKPLSEASRGTFAKFNNFRPYQIGHWRWIQHEMLQQCHGGGRKNLHQIIKKRRP